MAMRYFKVIAGLLFMVCLFSSQGWAQNFTGVFSANTADGQNILDIKQSGGQVSGTYTVGPTRLSFNALIMGTTAKGKAVLDGTPVHFFVTLTLDGSNLKGELTEENDQGQPDPYTTEKINFVRSGSSGGSAAAAAPTSCEPGSPQPTPTMGQGQPSSNQGLAAQSLQNVVGRLKANFKRESGSKVLSAGNPPLTLDSVTAFAELLRLAFDVEMTEGEFAATSQHFIEYYQKGDAQTKMMLAGGWQNILLTLQKSSGADRAKGIQELRGVMSQTFAAGAKTGMPWAVAMNATIQKRNNTVAQIQGQVPEYAKKSDLHQQMTEADLDSSLEMLYFMWVGCGRDPALVTPETVANVRMLIVQNFPTFPPQVQYVFANAQKVYSSLRGQWAQATQAQRTQMAQQFSVSLDQLGLTVPQPRAQGGMQGGNGAWSDMNGQSHSDWAASMVQGMAGNSYHSSW